MKPHRYHKQCSLTAEGEEHLQVDDPEFWMVLLAAVWLMMLAGCFSGLTVGLLGMDETQLQMIAVRRNTPYHHAAVGRLRYYLQDHHRLLVSLLLGNTIALETLPILLDWIAPAWAAVFVSVVCVLVFSEIFPMALLTGDKRIDHILMLECLVKGSLLFFAPAAIPIGRLLDWIVHKEAPHGACSEGGSHCADPGSPDEDPEGADPEARGLTGGLSKRDLGALIQLSLGRSRAGYSLSALRFDERRVADCMKGWNEVFFLYADDVLDAALTRKIREMGYSRVPVVDRAPRPSGDDGGAHIPRFSSVAGLLLTKNLIGLDVGVVVGSLPLAQPLYASSRMRLRRLLEEFRRRDRPKLAIVLREEYAHLAGSSCREDVREDFILGLCSMEEVLEELLQHELEDEFDEERRIFSRSTSVDEPAASPETSPRPGSARQPRGSPSLGSAATPANHEAEELQEVPIARRQTRQVPGGARRGRRDRALLLAHARSPGSVAGGGAGGGRQPQRREAPEQRASLIGRGC